MGSELVDISELSFSSKRDGLWHRKAKIGHWKKQGKYKELEVSVGRSGSTPAEEYIHSSPFKEGERGLHQRKQKLKLKINKYMEMHRVSKSSN